MRELLEKYVGQRIRLIVSPSMNTSLVEGRLNSLTDNAAEIIVENRKGNYTEIINLDYVTKVRVL